MFAFGKPLVRVVLNPKHPVAAFFLYDPHEHINNAVAELRFGFLNTGKVIPLPPSDAELGYRAAPLRNALDKGLWSPDGEHLVLLASHYGPLHVVKTTRLAVYLKNGEPDYALRGQYRATRDCPAHVCSFGKWLSNSVLQFWDGACGASWDSTFHVGRKRYLSRKCSSGRCG